MVDTENDAAVTHETSEAAFPSLRIVQGVDCLIQNLQYRHGECISVTYYLQQDIPTDTYCPFRPRG